MTTYNISGFMLGKCKKKCGHL